MANEALTRGCLFLTQSKVFESARCYGYARTPPGEGR